MNRTTSAAEAVGLIAPGTRILVGSGAAQPVELVDALAGAPQLADNEVVHLLTLGPAPYVEARHEGRLRHCAFFIGRNVRAAVREGRADFMPVFLHEIPKLIRSRRVRIDVALIQVSPPDAHGYVSLGVSVDVVRAAVDVADRVIAEVNPRMPRTHGDSFVHVRDLHALVAVDRPLLCPEIEPRDPITDEIGRQVATLVPDGATLQLGIGRIPDAVLSSLSDRHHLGVHSEMISDGVMHLVEAGVVTGHRKGLLPGKVVCSFLMGSEALYRWAADNPVLEMRGSEFTNDPWVIGQNERMVSINSALAVDLTGQVASDSLADGFFSGIGGQVDFVRGAARSPGGRPIIALPSRARGGTVSRICPSLAPGVGVVTSRGDVHYIVTEYGVADLWGKSVRERAMALVAIAHPDFRGELLAAAKERRFVLPAQVEPRGRYPWADEHGVTLPGAVQVVIRPLRVTDLRAVQELLYRCSDEALYRRFLAHQAGPPEGELARLANLDYERNVALVVLPSDCDEVVAMARYDIVPATGYADVAFLVRDDWQGRGVGTALFAWMSDVARRRGVPGFELEILASNRPMLGLLQRSGLPYRGRCEAGVHHFIAELQPAGAPPSTGSSAPT